MRFHSFFISPRETSLFKSVFINSVRASLCFFFATTASIHAETAEAPAPELPPSVCGAITAFDGEVQILDSDRVHIKNAKKNAPIACNSWVSVIHGWVRIHHETGSIVHIGDESFVRLAAYQDVGENSSHDPIDQVVLYKGLIYSDVRDGAPELRIASPVGRVRVKQGKVIFLSADPSDQVQLITLKNSATLENKFEPSRKVTVEAGESAELNFKLLRVIPSLPKLVSIASLKEKLFGLKLEDGDQKEAVELAVGRQYRQFPSKLMQEIAKESEDSEEAEGSEKTSDSPSEKKTAPTVKRRSLASLPESPQNPDSPESKEASEFQENPRGVITLTKPSENSLHKHWVRKMVGGDGIGQQILFPDKFYGKLPKVQITTEQPKLMFNERVLKQEEKEKKKLIDELSKIRVE